MYKCVELRIPFGEKKKRVVQGREQYVYTDSAMSLLPGGRAKDINTSSMLVVRYYTMIVTS
jgi:hypothetical protein